MSLLVLPCCSRYLAGLLTLDSGPLDSGLSKLRDACVAMLCRVWWIFIAPVFSHCGEGLGPHPWLRAPALPAATPVPRVAFSWMGCVASDFVHSVYSAAVDFCFQLVTGATCCAFGLLGVSLTEGKKVKSHEGKFLPRSGYKNTSQVMCGIQVAAASILAAHAGVLWHLIGQQPQSAAALLIAEMLASLFVASVFLFRCAVGLLELLRAIDDLWQRAAVARAALNGFLTLVINFCGWLNFVC